jgi:hypothetical protein
MIVGFGWGGWVTAGTANQIARRQANAAVTSAQLLKTAQAK